jgi:hypothetical protein
MKEIWDWIEKYILGKNYNIKCGNGLNKIYHNHKSRGIGSTELIRKTFYLKHWGGPIGEVKYYYECGQVETIEIWEQGKKHDDFKMIEHTGYNRDGSVKDGIYEEYLSQFDLSGTSNNLKIFFRERSYWHGVDEDVMTKFKVITDYKEGKLQNRKVEYNYEEL